MSSSGVICSLPCTRPSFLGYRRPGLPGFVRKPAEFQESQAGSRNPVFVSLLALILGEGFCGGLCLLPWQDGRTEGDGGRGYDKECRGARDARVGLRRSVSPRHLPTAGGTAAPSGPALTWEGGRQPAWSPRVPISATCSESVPKGGFTPRVSVGPPRDLGGGRVRDTKVPGLGVVLCTGSSTPSGTVGRRSISSVPSALPASGCSAP